MDQRQFPGFSRLRLAANELPQQSPRPFEPGAGTACVTLLKTLPAQL